MSPELETLLLVASGAALLVTGGATLRGGAIARLAGREQLAREKLAEHEAAHGDLARRLDRAERDAAEARERLATAKDARAQQEQTFEAKKRALEEQVEALGKQVKSLTGELEAASANAAGAERATQLEGDLKAEQQLSKQMEASLAEVRAALKKAQEETKSLETKLKAAEDRARATSPKPPPVVGAKADPKVEAELAATKSSLATVTQERDQARLKVEALERLVEGVRLRSKELTQELKELKEKHGWGG